jgi:Protein of unknown function (DUF3014)
MTVNPNERPPADQPPADYELRPVPVEPPPSSRSLTPPIGVWVAAALVAAAGAAYTAFIWWPRPQPEQPTRAASEAASVELPHPLGGAAEPVTLPPLDASDAVVRTLVRALSTSPAVTAWLATNGLIRNFTVSVANIADGVTPAKHLSALRPASGFRVIERDGQPYLDPKGYDRFASIADAVASVEPAGAATLYATLKPRIEEAARDLGLPDPSFDRVLERALVTLLNTPVVDGQIRLKPKGIGYAYADDRLEALTGAQKQLLRMGPRNVRTIKAGLREIALALGVPASHLPAD